MGQTRMEVTTQKVLPEPADLAADEVKPRAATSRPRGRRRRASDHSLPETLGDYLLVERLGTGGMGDVFKAVRAAEDSREGPRQFFAVKRIRPEVSQDRELVKRLVDEARITALLDHPNIVKVFDFQQAERSYFIVMEYLDGADLASVLRALKRTKMSLRAAPVAEIGVQAARGLHYAHTFVDAQGHPSRIVHRDISPSNLMLSRDGRVKIVDFGVAKASEMLRMTETIPGTVRGKPAYFSPEQARGEALDGRSDIFSLGVTLWELLTGRRLFSGPSSVERIKALLGAPLEPPSVYRPGIPPAIDRIVMRALQRERSRRYQTAGELANDLEDFLASNPVRNDALPYVLRTLFRAARTGHVPVSGDTLATPVTRSLSGPVSAPASAAAQRRGRRQAEDAHEASHEASHDASHTGEATVGLGPTGAGARGDERHEDTLSQSRAVSGMLPLKRKGGGDPMVFMPTPLPLSAVETGVIGSRSVPALSSGGLPVVTGALRGETWPRTGTAPSWSPPFGPSAWVRRRSLWLAVVGVLLGLVGARTWHHLRQGSDGPVQADGSREPSSPKELPVASASRGPEIASVPSAPAVELDLRSEPAGAVVSSSAGVLGTTPLVVSRPISAVSERFQFQREGFETATLDVTPQKNVLLQVSLRPRAAATATAPASRPKAEPSASPSRTKAAANAAAKKGASTPNKGKRGARGR